SPSLAGTLKLESSMRFKAVAIPTLRSALWNTVPVRLSDPNDERAYSGAEAAPQAIDDGQKSAGVIFRACSTGMLTDV
ncbi:MAG TPA: hypothetical protein VF485_14785, partial [Sphingomonas sp.]